MKNRAVAILLALFALSCATTPPAAPPSPAPGFGGLEADPRLGYSGATDARASRRFDAAMADLSAGREQAAREKLEASAAAHPPARLALAAIAIERGDLDAAARLLEALPEAPGWVAADFYRARLLEERGDLDAALRAYRTLASSTSAPAATAARSQQIETQLFDAAYQEALNTTGEASIHQLRRALDYRPDSSAARLLLAQRLVGRGELAQARMELDPILQSARAEEPAVQATLAEIDAGRKRYEEAIARYERVVARDADPRYAKRLREIKREFELSNMPQRYRVAAASPALTRAQLATLIYWSITPVRFGRPSGEPPIAVDIADISGREELIRNIAWGIWSVDPATRRVDPGRVVTGINAARALYRVLTLQGLPPCAASGIPDARSSEATVAALRSCGVDVTRIASAPDSPVSGSWAVEALEQIEEILADRRTN